jgi:murein tripeptide amidase MpaA
MTLFRKLSKKQLIITISSLLVISIFTSLFIYSNGDLNNLVKKTDSAKIVSSTQEYLDEIFAIQTELPNLSVSEYNQKVANLDLDLSEYDSLPTKQEESSLSEEEAFNIDELDFEREPGYEDKHENTKVTYTPESVKNDINLKEPISSQQIIQTQNQVTPQADTLIGFTDSSIPNGAMNISIEQSFTVTFDFVPSQQTIDGMRFYPAANFETELNGNVLTVTPDPRLSTHTNYIFGFANYKSCRSVNSDLCSNDGQLIEDWKYALEFSTVWKETFVIGRSYGNRDIVAHMYGRQDPGSEKILLTGATHGEEWRAGGLWKWVDFLDSNPQEIVNTGKQMIVIPEINVDGAAFNKKLYNEFGNAQRQDGRLNGRRVNLNRNFPTSNWKTCSYTFLGGPANCGTSGGSERETKAVMEVVQKERPTHQIAYHAQWPPFGIIFLGDNSNPDTRWFSRWVSDRTGYPLGVYDGPETDSEGVPGDQSVWSETKGTRSILIEATYRSNDDYSKNYPMYVKLLNEL